MTYNILTIRTAEFEDGSLHPVLGDEKSETEFEPRDGHDIKTLFANSLRVHQMGQAASSRSRSQSATYGPWCSSPTPD